MIVAIFATSNSNITGGIAVHDSEGNITKINIMISRTRSIEKNKKNNIFINLTYY